MWPCILVEGSHFKECFLQTKFIENILLNSIFTSWSMAKCRNLSGFFGGVVGLIRYCRSPWKPEHPGKWTFWTWKYHPIWKRNLKNWPPFSGSMLIFTWNSKHPILRWLDDSQSLHGAGRFFHHFHPSIVKWVVSGSRQLCARNFSRFFVAICGPAPPSTSSYQWATWKRTDSFRASNQMAITTSTNQLGGGKKWRSYAWQDGFK